MNINFKLFVIIYLLSVSLIYGDNNSSTLPGFGLNINKTACLTGGGGLASKDNNVLSLMSNPATINRLRTPAAFFSYSAYPEDITYNLLGFAQKFNKFTLGFTFQQLNGGDITETYISGQLPIMTEKKVTYHTKLLSTVIAADLYKINLGIKIKYYYEKMADLSAESLLFDFGINKEKIYKKLNAGLYFGNLGQKFGYYKKYKMPYQFVLGCDYTFFDKLNISLDYIKNDHEKYYFIGGIDLLVIPQIKLRLSYNTNKDINNDVSPGLVFQYKNYKINYSYDLWDDYGEVHRFDFVYLFDKPMIKEPAGKSKKSDINTIICPNCGREIIKGYKFCKYCGYKLLDDKKSTEHFGKDNIELEKKYEKMELKETSIFPYQEIKKLIRKKEFYLAIVRIENRLLKAPTIELYKLLGDSYEGLKEYDKAIDAYNKAIELSK